MNHDDEDRMNLRELPGDDFQTARGTMIPVPGRRFRSAVQEGLRAAPADRVRTPRKHDGHEMIIGMVMSCQ